MNDFTFSLKNKSMEHFRNKYRKCDVLLIDDIQFLSGKSKLKKSFFTLLTNYTMQKNK